MIQRAAPAAGASPVGDSRKVFVRPKRLWRLRVVVRRGHDVANKMKKTGANLKCPESGRGGSVARVVHPGDTHNGA